ncbi:MAG: hypothetical protein KF832_06965 [Caldilineaceae bacterium]|nr:hypothetical protein [Caldilineaceae bacterium]
MSIPFTQSLQSLQADRGYTPLVTISIASLFLLLWSIWFFVPSLTVYVTGQIIGVTRSGNVVATFPPQVGTDLWPGQSARIRPTGPLAEQLSAFPAIVLEVEPRPSTATVEVMLYPASEFLGETRLPGNVTGAVSVETEIISPAVLLLRATGQFVQTPPLVLSPQ